MFSQVEFSAMIIVIPVIILYVMFSFIVIIYAIQKIFDFLKNEYEFGFLGILC